MNASIIPTDLPALPMNHQELLARFWRGTDRDPNRRSPREKAAAQLIKAGHNKFEVARQLGIAKCRIRLLVAERAA